MALWCVFQFFWGGFWFKFRWLFGRGIYTQHFGSCSPNLYIGYWLSVVALGRNFNPQSFLYHVLEVWQPERLSGVVWSEFRIVQQTVLL
mgnify:CR=1 FL=1